MQGNWFLTGTDEQCNVWNSLCCQRVTCGSLWSQVQFIFCNMQSFPQSQPNKLSEVLHLFSWRWMILPANPGRAGQGLLLRASGGRLLFPSSCPPCCRGEWVISHVMFGCLLGKPLLRWKACLLFLWRWNKKLERSVNPLGWELWCSALGACFQLWK